MPDVVTKQTIKQAKASFKARGRPSLSDRESRRLQRAIELEQRAERAKEAEKRRLEAAKKRAEKERREQPHHQQVQLGTQRRCDRFGYKSSQFHLGAFFGKKPAETRMLDTVRGNDEQEGFSDDDLDDASLLGALDRPAAPELQQSKYGAELMTRPPLPAAAVVMHQRRPPVLPEDFSDFFDSLESGTQIARALDSPTEHRVAETLRSGQPAQHFDPLAVLMPPPPLPCMPATNTKGASPPQVQEDLNGFFDDLESSTQIARELDNGSREGRRASDASGSSFDSGSLDLTEEDMEKIDPSKKTASISPSLAATASLPKSQSTPAVPIANNSRVTPIPPVHVVTASMRSSNMTLQSQPTAKNSHRQTMPPPALSTRRPPFKNANTNPHMPEANKRQTPAIRGPFLPASSLYCSPDLGFTSTQLESFIDDDLQLTQVG